MAESFFSLKSPFEVFKTQFQLSSYLMDSDRLDDVMYEPNVLGPLEPQFAARAFRCKTFKNVSFSKTTITDVSFRDCKFIDCLFLGTRFVNCEFQNCTFVRCNPHKVIFEKTFIDPLVFEGMLDKSKHSNIGINLFHQLYKNSMEMHQDEFARTAEFNRQKWLRYVLDRRYEKWARVNPKWLFGWSANILYYSIGYGIRFKFLLAWICMVSTGALLLNFYLWDCLDVVGKKGPLDGSEFSEVLYYTAAILGRANEFGSTSVFGRWILYIEGYAGLFLGSLVLSWLFKRFLR